MNPLVILGLIAAGYYGYKNRSKLLAKLHTHESTQEWLRKQTPEDQALYNQMMATSGAFAVGQMGYYPDPSQYAYFGDPSPYPSQGYGGFGYGDPTSMYGDPSSQYGATYGDNQLPGGPGTCPPGQYWNISQQQCLQALGTRGQGRGGGRGQSQGRGQGRQSGY